MNDSGNANSADPPILLRLYVAGESPSSQRAIINLQALCREHSIQNDTIEIVDILKEPLRPFQDGVFLTPMLIKLAPPPVFRLVGDLSDMEKVLPGLERALKAADKTSRNSER